MLEVGHIVKARKQHHHSCDSMSLSAHHLLNPIGSKSKEEAFKADIENFFDYDDIKARLDSYHASYQQTGSSSSTTSRIHAILTELEKDGDTSQERRMALVESLLYIALGHYADPAADRTETSFIRLMLENSLLLYASDAMETVFDIVKKLTQATESLDQDKQDHHHHLDQCITFLYVITASCHHSLESVNTGLLKELASSLFELVANTRKPIPPAFPMKKTLLLLQITLTTLLGTTEDAKSVKNEVRSLYGLTSSQDGMRLKSSPKDLYDFRNEVKAKFTLYQPPSYPLDMKTPCVVKATDELNDAMGVTATADDLLYRIRFPPKHTVETAKGPLPATIEFKNELKKVQSRIPFTTGIPKAIQEAGDLLLSYMHLSLADYQIIREREYTLAFRKQQHQDGQAPSLDDMEDHTTDHPSLSVIDALYTNVVTTLPQFIVVVLDMLVAAVQPPPSCADENGSTSRAHADLLRNREIVRSTVTSILLLMHKWFKVSHVLKYEYLSQLLVDSGYLLLALRAFLMEDIKTIAFNSPDNAAYGFFGHIAVADGNQIKASYSSSSSSSYTSLTNSWEASTSGTLDVVDDVDVYTNERNMTWMLDTLRILQMLTKEKMCRIKLMVSYKAWVPLKRIAKAYQDSRIELYALKLMKSQVPHLGLKWRSSNMRVISAISRHCAYGLREDWLSTTEFDEQDDAQDMMHELNLRTLIKLYHGRKYFPDLLTNLVEEQQQQLTFLIHEQDMLNGIDGWDETGACDENENNHGWGDTAFNPSASQWDTDTNTITDTQRDIGTPLPGTSPQPITPEMLTEAINHLYYSTTKKTPKQQVPEVVDGWDTPSLMRSTTATKRATEYDQSDDDEDDDTDDQKDADDPLKDIDWENLTEEELNERLAKVDEQTEQRWLNVDIDDPAYCKVLNTFEITNDAEDNTDDPWLQ